MATSTGDLCPIAASAGTQPETDGELTAKAGQTAGTWPPSIREMVCADWDSGAYEEAALTATAGQGDSLPLRALGH